MTGNDSATIAEGARGRRPERTYKAGDWPRTTLLDRVVVCDPRGDRIASWTQPTGTELADPEPWVLDGVERLGWTLHRHVRVGGTLALPPA
jgi:hypothetical protein